MQHTVLVDYELAVAQQGFIVRALLKLEGKAPTPDNRIPLNLSVSSTAPAPWPATSSPPPATPPRCSSSASTPTTPSASSPTTMKSPPLPSRRPGAQAGLTNQIKSIQPGGSTNLSGGWLRARELVARGKREGGVNRVVLLTDGLANAASPRPISC
jgi:hypothetical protein